MQILDSVDDTMLVRKVSGGEEGKGMKSEEKLSRLPWDYIFGCRIDGGWWMGLVQVVVAELQKELLPLSLHKVRGHRSTSSVYHGFLSSHLSSSWVETS